VPDVQAAPVEPAPVEEAAPAEQAAQVEPAPGQQAAAAKAAPAEQAAPVAPAPVEEPATGQPAPVGPTAAEGDASVEEARVEDPAPAEPAPAAVAASSFDPAGAPPEDRAADPAAEEVPIAEQRTVEWSPAPADATGPDPEAPMAPLPPPVVPRTTAKRGRWRRERGNDPLVPTRPRNSANRGKSLRRILAVLALVLIAAALYLINATFEPFHGDGRGSVRVTIPAGADAGRIGEILESRGVVASSTFFSLNATLTGRRGGLRDGTYTLPRDMSYGAAIDALVQGPSVEVVQTFDLSLPEGRTIDETADALEDTSIEGDYVAAARSAAARRRARALGLPTGAKSVEGFLFPATYELPEGTSARELVDRQLSGFRDNTAKVSYARAKRLKLSRYDVLIIASMIEREAQLDRERPLVASVIYNRLEEGIPLGIDATIRYATDNWTRPIRQSELEKDGPYNTRTRRGLPPTPIGNPGLASIRAAAAPRNTSYLYYVVKPGSKGAHAFSRTDAEFQRDVARYQASRDANGGQAP
jgi:UPF0755 protein